MDDDKPWELMMGVADIIRSHPAFSNNSDADQLAEDIELAALHTIPTSDLRRMADTYMRTPASMWAAPMLRRYYAIMTILDQRGE